MYQVNLINMPKRSLQEGSAPLRTTIDKISIQKFAEERDIDQMPKEGEHFSQGCLILK
jgi:hypothetical protein